MKNSQFIEFTQKFKILKNLTSHPLALIVPINDDIKYRDSTASLPSAHQGHPPEIRINSLTR